MDENQQKQEEHKQEGFEANDRHNDYEEEHRTNDDDGNVVQGETGGQGFGEQKKTVWPIGEPEEDIDYVYMVKLINKSRFDSMTGEVCFERLVNYPSFFVPSVPLKCGV